MKNKIFVGIPILNRIDLLKRCVACIDVPAYIVIINNNTTDPVFNSELSKLAEERGLDVRTPRYNLGVAASWNEIIKLGMGFGYEEIFIGSNDTMLGAGTLQGVIDMEKHDDEVIWHIHAWNFWLIHTRAIPRVGWLDENFYPAYCEDVDYSYRCDKLAKDSRRVVVVRSNEQMPNTHLGYRNIPEGPATEHIGSQTINSDAEYKAHNNNTHYTWNRSHYTMKWGAWNPHETFKTPYNKPDVDHRWWPNSGNSLAVRDWDNGRRAALGKSI